MQGCHANFYLDRISLGAIQDLAPMAHPAFSWPDFLFQFNTLKAFDRINNHLIAVRNFKQDPVQKSRNRLRERAKVNLFYARTHKFNSVTF
ncbi:hypothetical protein EDI28_17385 [Photobacterium chitinilyticum]|uniref:Uncharacterized protein n=2 Tax=Photobacterium chitinilyticum TaxID=2485123 RepID=A0A444JN96_9GAMM|nr:hypothetical protein EDI28_17385 [Photobacterium chitinilyticum]